ncbi:MAG: hypothetical protein DRH04_08640, partial [Deltaproteobacteria bacterium]
NFVEKDFNRYMAGASGFRKKAMAVGFGALLLAMGIGGAAAVMPPDWETTAIYDQNDTSPPSPSWAAYTKAPSGDTTVPLTVIGYESVGDPIGIRVIDSNGIEAWTGEYWYPFDGNTINAILPENTPLGECTITMYSDELGGWITPDSQYYSSLDSFQLAEPEKPIPEFPSIGLVTMGLLMVYGLHNHYKRKGQL